MVVSGYASREVANNDLQRVTCPDVPMQSREERTQVWFESQPKTKR